MLSPVIMVGCGGSGTKAVRYARDAVTRRLREVGWTRPLPGAWTFLGLDTNDQEGVTQIPLLPPDDFLKLSSNITNYSALYNVLLRDFRPGTDSYDQHLIGWLPEQDGPDIDLGKAAGQIRAVGRATGLHTLGSDIRNKLVDAFQTAQNGDGLADVSTRLTGTADNIIGSPIVMVCSSISGGTGAGVALDIVELIRRTNRKGQHPALLLFTNDIFGEKQNRHTAGNSLGVLCELLASYWNDDRRVLGPGDIFDSTAPNPGHGPFSVWVVGSTNMKGETIGDKQTTGDKSVAVYQAVGEALSFWVTEPQIQENFQAWLTGNWQASSTLRRGGYPFDRGQQSGVVSSFGTAVVTLGRTRFERWAHDLLSRCVLDRIVSGHRKDISAKDAKLKDADLIDQIVLEYLDVVYGAEFPERTELDRTDRKGYARTYALFVPASTRKLRDQISNQLEEGLDNSRGIAARDWDANIKLSYDHCASQVMHNACSILDEDKAAWGKSIVEHISEAISYVVAHTSVQVAIRCIDQLNDELRVIVADENTDAKNAVELAETALSQARRQLWNIKGALLPLDRNKSAVTTVFDATVDLLVKEWSRVRDEEVGKLIELAIDNVNSPLRDVLENGKGIAERSLKEDDVKKWPDRVESLPKEYLPSAIELTLESEDHWKTLLEGICENARRPTTEGKLPVEAATTLLIAGDETDAVEPLVAPKSGADRGWRPGRGAASFVCLADRENVKKRVEDWITSGDFATVVQEGIRSYLTPGDGYETGSVNYEARQAVFRSQLATAARSAHPLLEIDDELFGIVYSGTDGGSTPHVSLECSQLPFVTNHPSLIDAKEILGEVIALRSDDTPSVLITSFISQPVHPIVATSITAPIAEAVSSSRGEREELQSVFWLWKRTRTLQHFIPVPPETLRVLIRGYAVARLCGYLSANPDREALVEITGLPPVGGSEAVVKFPSPFLSKVKWNSEILPALLESFALCYADVGRRQLEAFEAYRRLFELGDPPLIHLERVLRGEDPQCKLLWEAKVRGSTEDVRRESTLDYLQQNIDLFRKVEARRLTGQESSDDFGYSYDDIPNVSLREILPVARECYEDLQREIQEAGSLAQQDPTI